MLFNHSNLSDGGDAVSQYAMLYMKYQDKIREYQDKQDWDGLVDYLANYALKRTEKDHWLTVQLAIAYIEKRDYTNAKKTLRAAIVLNDDCVIVAFLSGFVVMQEDKCSTAVLFLKAITEAGVNKIFKYASCPCCAEKEQAQSIVADSNFLLSECYSNMGNSQQAILHEMLHREAVRDGVASLFGPETEDED